MQLHLNPITTTPNRRNVLVALCCFCAVPALSKASQAASNATPDAAEIVKRSVAAGDRNAVRVRGYSSTKRVDEKQLDLDGSVKSETRKTFDQVVIDGMLVRRLVSKDGKPLPTSDERKEDDRVRKIISERKHESPQERASRLAEEEKKRDKQRALEKEIFEAFTFRLIGEGEINGRKNWQLEATPVPGYHPRELRAQIFPHLKAQVWIDQQDYLWTRAEAIAISPFSIGFGFIARLDEGARLYLEQTRHPDGVWLIKDTGLHGVAHVAIVKRIGIERVSRFDNFRKVPAGVEVVEDSTGR
jgi:hypothetical protein